MKQIIFLLIATILIPQSTYAESPKLSLCNGIWTTKACDNPEKSFEGINRPNKQEVPAPVDDTKTEKVAPVSDENKADSKVEDNVKEEVKEPAIVPSQKKVDSQVNIRDLMRPLLARVEVIKSNYQKDFDISKTKFICEAKDVDIEDCRDSIAEDLDKARDYEIKLEELAMEEKQLEEGLKAQDSNEQNMVTVNNFNTRIPRGHDRYQNKRPTRNLDTEIVPQNGRETDIITNNPKETDIVPPSSTAHVPDKLPLNPR